MSNLKVKFYSDPGHGWVAVKRQLLVDLGILDKITLYSYQKGNTVYLEEDCDFSTLMTALSNKGIALELDRKCTNKSSPIRCYQRFMA